MRIILGTFIFETNSLLPNERQRSRKQNISSHSILGQRDKLQHLGPGTDEKTLSGKIFPGKLGSADSLDALSDMADSGGEHRLIDDQGVVHGKWMIDSIDETKTLYDNASIPRQIDFKIKLRRTA